MKMKRETLKEILLNLDLMANKELDEKRKQSFELIKQWFISYADNISQDSLHKVWGQQWSQELEASYYDFPIPNEVNHKEREADRCSELEEKELEIHSRFDRYSASEYKFYKVEEALFLKAFKGHFVYLVGHNESYITATSKIELKETGHLVLLKNDTEAILLDGTELKLEVKAA